MSEEWVSVNRLVAERALAHEREQERLFAGRLALAVLRRLVLAWDGTGQVGPVVQDARELLAAVDAAGGGAGPR